MRKITLLLVLCFFTHGCMEANIDLNSLAKSLRNYEIGKLPFDPDNPFLQRKTIFLCGGINLSVAQTVSEQLLYLDRQSGDEPIKLLINSGGGDCTAYLAIRNTIKSNDTPVNTSNVEHCGSSAFARQQSTTGKRCVCEVSAWIKHESKGGP